MWWLKSNIFFVSFFSCASVRAGLRDRADMCEKIKIILRRRIDHVPVLVVGPVEAVPDRSVTPTHMRTRVCEPFFLSSSSSSSFSPSRVPGLFFFTCCRCASLICPKENRGYSFRFSRPRPWEQNCNLTLKYCPQILPSSV